MEALNTYSWRIRLQGRCGDCRHPLCKRVCHPRNPSHVHFPGKQKKKANHIKVYNAKNAILKSKANLVTCIKHRDKDKTKR